MQTSIRKTSFFITQAYVYFLQEGYQICKKTITFENAPHLFVSMMRLSGIRFDISLSGAVKRLIAFEIKSRTRKEERSDTTS